MQFAQLADKVETATAEKGSIDISAFPGMWVNSNPDTSGIARLKMTQSNGKLSLQVFAIGPNGLIDWGTEEVSVFTSSPVSRTGAGFTCVFDFGFADTRLQGMIMKGLLVLAQFHRFKDDSRRVSYFLREYFALEHGRY
ncbi:MAG TPA: hypothetical protein VMZ30_02405 [Pyrinomonadaceae bacterium]|nr:hypothetical protein [Pyrinomonadaceae bacterium]